MKINKKALLISLAILALIGISILLYFLLPTILMPKEERFLNSFMGEYIITEHAFESSPEPPDSLYEEYPGMPKSRYYFNEERYVGLHKLTGIYSFVPAYNVYNSADLVDPVKYTCVKIDDDFLNNKIQTQGVALRKLFHNSSNFHEQVKEDAFAVFVRTPATEKTYPEYKDEIVFYYIDGKYYAIDNSKAFFMDKIR